MHPLRLSLTTRVVIAALEPLARNAASKIVMRVGTQEPAADVAQDALLIVATRLARLQSMTVAALEAFTWGVVFNRARGIAARERRQRRTGGSRTAVEPTSLAPGPLDRAIERDLVRRIRRAASSLHGGDRQVAAMMLRGRCSRIEIARRLEIDAGLAPMRKHRALCALRAAARIRSDARP